MSGGRSKNPNQQGSKISVVLTPTGISSKEIKVKVQLLNSLEERTIRFSLNGSLSSDCTRQTASKEAEFVFPVPKNTTEARVKAEIMDGSRFYDEITVSIPQDADKQPTGKDSKNIQVQISRPNETETFFISVFTVQAGEKIFISSTEKITVSSKKKKEISGNQFVFSSGPDKILFLQMRFEGQKTVCFFNGQKRMLIK